MEKAVQYENHTEIVDLMKEMGMTQAKAENILNNSFDPEIIENPVDVLNGLRDQFSAPGCYFYDSNGNQLKNLSEYVAAACNGNINSVDTNSQEVSDLLRNFRGDNFQNQLYNLSKHVETAYDCCLK